MNSNTFTDVCQVSRWVKVQNESHISTISQCFYQCVCTGVPHVSVHTSSRRVFITRLLERHLRGGKGKENRVFVSDACPRVSLSTHLFICLSVSSAPVSLLTYISADLTFQPFYPSIHLPACCSVSLFAWPVGSQLSLRESLSNASYVVFILYIIW